MSTKKEQLTLAEIQEQVAQNKKLIQSNAYNTDQLLTLVGNNKRKSDKDTAQCHRVIMLAFIALGSLVVFAEFIKYVM